MRAICILWQPLSNIQYNLLELLYEQKSKYYFLELSDDDL